jgi:CheY-like chemotaxis protein
MAPKRNILIVEDHRDTLSVMERLLRSCGHATAAAADATTALALHRDHAFDLAFIDIGLPEMTGIELLARMRAIRPVTAVSLSGHCMPDELEAQARAGFARCIAKPCVVEDLLRAVEELAAAHGISATAP